MFFSRRVSQTAHRVSLSRQARDYATLSSNPKSPISENQTEESKAYGAETKVRVFFWPAGYLSSTISEEGKLEKSFVEAPLSTVASRAVRSAMLESMADKNTVPAIVEVTGKHLVSSPAPGHLALEVIHPNMGKEYLSIGPILPAGAHLKSTALTSYKAGMIESLEADVSSFNERKHLEPLEITFVDPKLLIEAIRVFRKDPNKKYALFGGKIIGPEGESCASVVLNAIITADYKAVLDYKPSFPPTPEGVFEALKQTQLKYEEEQKQESANHNARKDQKNKM